MSDDPGSPTPPPDDFPVPRHFVLTPVKDGAYKVALPTVTAVYLGSARQPDRHFLMGMVGVSLDPHETDAQKLIMHLFIQPDDDDEEDNGVPEEGLQMFTDTCGFELSAEKKTMDEFMASVAKVKAFTLAISCDEFYFHCRVDTESTMVDEVKCDWRFLN